MEIPCKDYFISKEYFIPCKDEYFISLFLAIVIRRE